MTNEIAKKVSELYTKKSKILEGLSDVSNPAKLIFIGQFYPYRVGSYLPITGLNQAEHYDSIKKYAKSLLEEELIKVDEEISKINCN